MHNRYFQPYVGAITARLGRRFAGPVTFPGAPGSPERLRAEIDGAIAQGLPPAVIESLRAQLARALRIAASAPAPALRVAGVAGVAKPLVLQEAPTETSAPIGFIPSGTVVRMLNPTDVDARSPYPPTPAAVFGWALVQTLSGTGTGVRGFVPMHLLLPIVDQRYATFR